MIRLITNRKKQFGCLVILVGLSLLASHFLKAQEMAHITFSEKSNCSNCCTQINKTNILNDRKTYSVIINSKGLDTMYIDTSKRYNPSVLKLKKDHYYHVLCNQSSTKFELIPVSGKKSGMVRFSKSDYENKMGIRAFNYSIEDSVLFNNIPTRYFKKKNNYYNNEIIIFKKVKEVDRNSRVQPLAVVNLIFLHGERYTINYNGKTRKSEVIFDGYIE